MDKYVNIGSRIIECRKKKRLSQKGFLASIMEESGCCDDMSDATLSKIEQGDSLPSAEFLVGLNRTFFVTPDYILFGEERLPVFQLADTLKRLSENEFERFFTLLCDLSEKWAHPAKPKNTAHRSADGNPIILDVSRRLQEVRKQKHLNQSELAKLLGVSRNTVSANERILERKPNGNQYLFPPMHYIYTFCQKLDVSASYILDAYCGISPRLFRFQEALPDFSHSTQLQLVKKILQQLNLA